MLTKRFFRKFSVVSGIIGSFYGEKASFSNMLRNRYNKKDIFDKHFAQSPRRQETRRQGSDPCLLVSFLKLDTFYDMIDALCMRNR